MEGKPLQVGGAEGLWRPTRILEGVLRLKGSYIPSAAGFESSSE